MGGQGRERALQRKKDSVFSPENCWTMPCHMECTLSMFFFAVSELYCLNHPFLFLMHFIYLERRVPAHGLDGLLSQHPLPACCSIATCFPGIRGLWQSWNFPFCTMNAERLIVKPWIFSFKPWKPCRGSAFRKLFFSHKENPSLWTDN